MPLLVERLGHLCIMPPEGNSPGCAEEDKIPASLAVSAASGCTPDGCCRATSEVGSLGLDQSSEQRLQHLEISVELPAGVVAESTGHFADGEPQYGSADETLYLTRSAFRHSRLD